MTSWDLATPDWEDRIRSGRSLVPDLPLNSDAAEQAVAVFNMLKLADVPGNPTLEEAAGEWFKDIVRALFGSWDPETKERYIREIFALVPKKNSKALALDTLIATPSGFTTMGAVQVDDEVIALDGTPTKVLAKSEVFTGHTCFEVEFSTGEKVTCDAEHLWVTDAHLDRQKLNRKGDKTPRPSVKTAAEIAASVKTSSGKYLINNHRTQLCGVIDLPDADLPIHPYVLGVWLGDGDKGGTAIFSGRRDYQHIMEQIANTGQTVRLRNGPDNKDNCATLTLSEPRETMRYVNQGSSFKQAIDKLGVTDNKHIPHSYLRASRDQRLALLRGLIDTDGHISPKSQANYSTTNRELALGVLELVNSFGFKGQLWEGRSVLNGVDHGPSWNISFWPFDELIVATLPRHVVNQKPTTAKNAPRSRTRQIVAVREVPSVPTQCIAVESETHQFLVTRSLIPTHNTSYGAGLMMTALILNQRPLGKFLLVAPTQDVTELAFGQCKGMIDLDPFLTKRFHIQQHLKKITDRWNNATLEVMSFDPTVLTGQKPTGFLVDELHVVAGLTKASSAVGQLRGGMIAQPEAFGLFITTQSEKPPAGVFKAELDVARAVRDGRDTQSRILPILYEFPPSIVNRRDEWKNTDNWKMVIPNDGRSITVERLIEEFAGAQRRGEEEIRRWASQHLNVEIGLALQSDRWAGADLWEAEGDPTLGFAEILNLSEVVVAGIDGGGMDDLMALGVLGRHKFTHEWMFWSHAWAHPIVMKRRKDIAGILKDFAAAGQLTIVESVGQDIEELVGYVARLDESGLLACVGLDPMGIGAVVDALAEQGIEGNDRVIGIPQGWQLAGAIKTTERKLADGTFVHGNQALMAWAVSNARVEPRGNAITITKQASGNGKIDPVMAMLNCVALMSKNPEALGGPSVYDERGLLRL